MQIGWLVIWTFAGIPSFQKLASQPSIAVFLLAWGIGWVVAVLIVLWQFFGHEIIRPIGSDLEVGYVLLGITKERLFRGNDIRDLSIYQDMTAGGLSLPFLSTNKASGLKFKYGTRTILMGTGHDEAECQLILNVLRKYLPATAMAAS